MTTQTPLILLVDDFEDALDMYREFLTFRGYRIVTASSGPEALAIAGGHERPTLILMDLAMVGMTGKETLRSLRNDPTLADVPVVAFTAHAMVDEQRDALLDGFDGFIPKPCNPDDLIALIAPFLTSGSSVPASLI